MIYFEPRSIDFNFAMIEVVGGRPPRVPLELSSPELTGSFRTDDGKRGTVSVPLTAEERATIQVIVTAASYRAFQLATEVVEAA